VFRLCGRKPRLISKFCVVDWKACRRTWGKGFRSLYSFVRTCTLTTMKCIVLAMLDFICIIDPVLVHICSRYLWMFILGSLVRDLRSLYSVTIVCYIYWTSLLLACLVVMHSFMCNRVNCLMSCFIIRTLCRTKNHVSFFPRLEFQHSYSNHLYCEWPVAPFFMRPLWYCQTSKLANFRAPWTGLDAQRTWKPEFW
jgi:hypothetical protein